MVYGRTHVLLKLAISKIYFSQKFKSRIIVWSNNNAFGQLYDFTPIQNLPRVMKWSISNGISTSLAFEGRKFMELSVIGIGELYCIAYTHQLNPDYKRIIHLYFSTVELNSKFFANGQKNLFFTKIAVDRKESNSKSVLIICQ